MPGMDGLMALRSIKEIDSTIQVVMISAIDEEYIAKQAKTSGACGYILKPFNLLELESLILSILEPANQRQNSK